MEKKKINDGMFVVPGDKLGVIEEYIPSRGTYTENGVIYSNSTGFVLIDKVTKEVKVYPAEERPLRPKKRDIVIGRIDDIKEKIAYVEIYEIRNRFFENPFTGILFVNQISREYIKSAKAAFKVGDIIKAQVINDGDPIQLSTAGRDLGVILAFCSKCGNLLKRVKNELRCPYCGNIERRYLSPQYGKM